MSDKGAAILEMSYPELHLAGVAASMRATSNLRDQRKPKYGAPSMEGSFECHWMGCLGELAVAKYCNLYWRCCGSLGASDVGGLVEVRTRRKEDYELMLHPGDRDQMPFVLVLLHKLPQVVLRGWIVGKDGKQPRFWKDPAQGRPAFFVPQVCLKPMSQLGPLVLAAKPLGDDQEDHEFTYEC